jgi:hypothetical protein
MKKTIITTALFCIAVMLTGCKDKENVNKICDCNNKTNSIDVIDLEGVVHFNNDIQQWYIAVHKEGTYDEVQLFLPCNLDGAYEVSNAMVLFSGIAFDISSDLNAPAGSKYLCVEILSICNSLQNI